MTKFELAELDVSPDKIEKMISDSVAQGFDRETVEREIKLHQQQECYLNDKYQVLIRRNITVPNFPNVHWLSIKRIDRESIHDWREMQEIKNQLIGDENEGFEIYPAESRKVDGANQYHMFVFVNDKIRIPVGFSERHVTDVPIGGSKQRPFSG